MDELRIKTPFMRKIVATVIGEALKKFLGVGVAFQIEDLDVVHDDEIRFDVHIKGSMGEEDFAELVKRFKP